LDTQSTDSEGGPRKNPNTKPLVFSYHVKNIVMILGQLFPFAFEAGAPDSKFS
jgi:hypothetical protein